MIRPLINVIQTKPLKHGKRLKVYPSDISDFLRKRLKIYKIQYNVNFDKDYKNWLRMFGFIQFIRTSHLTMDGFKRSKLKAIIKGNLSNDRLPKGWLRHEAAVALRQIEKKTKRK